MANIKNTDLLVTQIRLAIESLIADESEAFIEKAMGDYEIKLREIVAKSALRLAREVDFTSMEDRLRIEVRIK